MEHDEKIPIPETTFPQEKYYFGAMKIGDSVFSEGRKVTFAASTYKSNHPEFNYVSRQVEGGSRVWRIRA